MEGKQQHTQSVIAKLMGIEELPPKLPIPSIKKRRVLSENYLQKTASIGLREKSSIFVGRSTRINALKQQQVVNLFEVQIHDILSHEKSSKSAAKAEIQRYTDSFVKESDGVSGNLLAGSEARNLQVSKLYLDPVHSAACKRFSSPNYENISKVSNRSTRITVRDTLRSHPELATGSTTGNLGEFGIDHMKKIEFHSQPGEKTRHTKIVVLRPSSGRSHKSKVRLFSLSSGMESKSFNVECKEFTRTKNGAADNEAERESISVEPLRNSFRAPLRDKVSHSSKPIDRAVNVDESFLKSEALKPPSSSLFKNTRENGSPNSIANRTFLANEAKKQIIERWKLTDVSQTVEVGHRSQSLGEMLAMAEMETRTPFESCSNISPDNTVASASSCVEDGSTFTKVAEQVPWNGSHEIRSLSTERTMIDLESPQNPREMNQPSPNSVLEPPFKEEKLCTSELNDKHADLRSVALQLELLETNSEETYSEGSEMVVSSDDDDIERTSLDLCQENIMVLIDFNTEESRDYSYLVDVLDKSNLHDINLRDDYLIWNSSERPVNSSVFDMLEKKYGKQMSWPKSERKLLFDGINLGVSEILHSFTDVYSLEKSLKRRWHFTLHRNEVEEELWKLLVDQKKEVSKDLSGKALGKGTKWLGLEEEIGGICGEIESILFEELAAELVCVENV